MVYPSGPYPSPAPTSRDYPRQAFTPWLARCCAFVVDAIPVLAGAAVNQWVVIQTAGVQCQTYPSGGMACTGTPSAVGDAVSLLIGILILVCVLWNVGYRQGRTGSSLGKSLLRFRTVNGNTWQPVGFARSMVRALAHLVDALVCFVGFLNPIWDARRQTFADKIVGTVCIPVHPRPPR